MGNPILVEPDLESLYDRIEESGRPSLVNAREEMYSTEETSRRCGLVGQRLDHYVEFSAYIFRSDVERGTLRQLDAALKLLVGYAQNVSH